MSETAAPPRRRSRVGRRLRRWKKVYTPRTFVGLPSHEARWALTGDESIERWCDRRLKLDGFFWLFVLGLNNSGTSILAHLLETHPEIRALPAEGQALTKALPTGAELGVRRNWTTRMEQFHWTEDTHSDAALRTRYDWAYHANPRPGIVLEKSPPNTVRGRWLQEHFRPSRFIGIARHPYAVCEGMRRRGGLPVAESARHWALGNATMLDDADQLDRFELVTYEHICDQPDETLTRVESFLNLEIPVDRSILDTTLPSHTIDRAPSVLSNYNSRSIERLSTDDIAGINEVAGDVMDRLGYERH